MPTDPLDLLRARSGLSIDAEGRFLHRGEPITHARTLAVLWGSLARTAEGRWQVAIGRESAFVAVEETPWAVRGVRVEGAPERITLLLCGGREAPLAPDTLRLGEDGVLRCDLGPGPAEGQSGHAGRDRAAVTARFTRAGQVALGSLLAEDPPGSGRYVLPLAGARHPVGGAPPA